MKTSIVSYRAWECWWEFIGNDFIWFYCFFWMGDSIKKLVLWVGETKETEKERERERERERRTTFENFNKWTRFDRSFPFIRKLLDDVRKLDMRGHLSSAHSVCVCVSIELLYEMLLTSHDDRRDLIALLILLIFKAYRVLMRNQFEKLIERRTWCSKSMFQVDVPLAMKFSKKWSNFKSVGLLKV